VDVSYSRWLMVHLCRPVEAMRAIHAALKPGGVMVCEEADVSAVYAEPPSAAYTELRDICLEAPASAESIIRADAYHPHYLTGKHKGFWNWTLRALGEGLVREGTLAAARLDELVAGMNEADASPHTVVAHCRMHQQIAKKPH